VALHGTDVFTDFRSCVLCCSQFALNVRVQSPEGIREGDVSDDGGDIWQLVGLLGWHQHQF
jgi:hypothetical protein